jgi:hypothetical protein
VSAAVSGEPAHMDVSPSRCATWPTASSTSSSGNCGPRRRSTPPSTSKPIGCAPSRVATASLTIGTPYVWIAPVVMSPSLCEVIETFVVKIRGVTETGRGGGVFDTAESNQPSTPVRIRRRRSASTARCAMTDRQCAYLRELELVLPRLLRVASQRTLHPVLQRCSAGARGAELYA